MDYKVVGKDLKYSFYEIMRDIGHHLKILVVTNLMKPDVEGKSGHQVNIK